MHRFMHKLHFIAFLSMCSLGFALPGVEPPPELVNEIAHRLRAGQAEALVLVSGAEVSQVHTYVSSAGRRHVRFLFTVGVETFDGIVFEGDWTDEEVELLENGRAELVGVWETFRGRPSFTTKLVFGARVDGEHTATSEGAFVAIGTTSITNVDSYLSADGYNHVQFEFTVEGYDTRFAGVAFDGVWSRDMLLRLQAGSVVLIGSWDESGSSPLFVLRDVR